MSVQNYIAAFEAHSDVSRASPASSPGRRVTQDSDTMSSRNLAPVPIEPIPFERRDSDRIAGESDHSATGRASQSRRSRLQKQLDDPISPQSYPISPQSSPRGSLAERRRARQQRKQHQLQNKGSSSKTISRSEKQESLHTPPTNPQPRSQTRQRPESLRSNRRFGHTISAESDGPDESPHSPTSYRVSPARRDLGRGDASSATDYDYDYDDTQYADTGGTDDEATLTSVRQIMTNPMIQKPAYKDGMNQHGVVRAASSSSFEADPRQDMYQEAPTSSSFLPPRTDDEDTLDYADEDSLVYEARKKEAERRKYKRGYAEAPGAHSPLMNKDDMEHYRKTLDTPVVKTGAVVVISATIGTLLLGPVGLLVGAAAVGIGVGIMQIPEEQRTNMKDKATVTLHKAHESALNASETLSSTCASSCLNSGVANHLPPEMRHCFTQEDVQEPDDDHHSVLQGTEEQQRSDKGANTSFSGGNGGFAPDGNSHPSPGRRNRRVACLRDVRITAVDQIHGLPPQKQPRAWLDVMASANTSADEKSEAMEEIKILARDKRRARMLLEEGILDSLMYMLNRFFDKMRRGTAVDVQERFRAKLAASCCVTLGKAHCAAVHTEGDLLLMSMYERGTVPEERQLAQMLYEVPHHVLSKEPDVFALQQTSMPMAEELASSIKDLATL